MQKQKLILDQYEVGGEMVYGLKTPEGVLLPNHAPHTRHRFAKQKQKELLLELSKRMGNAFEVHGDYAKGILLKVNKCSKIMEYYAGK